MSQFTVFSPRGVERIRKTVRTVAALPSRATPVQQIFSAAPSVIRVKVEQDDGSAGDDASQCDFAYIVRDWKETKVLGGTDTTPIQPIMQRPPLGKMIAATVGLAFVDEDGALQLLWVDEVPDSGPCTE